MNVTRDVVTDLLPLYFSGEASEDTRRLVEDFFRENPDFERVARAAAKPLETLRNAAPAAPEAEKEKREMQCVGWELRSRRAWLFMAAFMTLWGLISFVSRGLGTWLGAPHTLGGRILAWCLAAFFCALYFVRPARHNVPLIGAVLVSLGVSAAVLNRLNIVRGQWAHANGPGLVALGLAAAFLWFLHFRFRAQDRPRNC